MEKVIPVNSHRTMHSNGSLGVHCANPSPFFRMWFLLGCIAFGQVWAETISAEPPRKLSEKAAERMIEEGDRFADQAEYLKAVQRYTDAYLGIVAQLRGQDFAEGVAPSLMTRKELADEMKRQMDLDYTEEELRLMEGTFKVFGLVPKNLDVKGLMTKLLTEEVGGFYDPRTKAMVLIRENDRAREPGMFGKLLGQRPTFDKEEQKITLAHELTHALQDQLYGLLQIQNAIEKDDDMSLAFSALVEGDATLVMFGEMGRQEGDILGKTQMDPEAARFMFNMMKMMLPIAGGKTYRGAPPIFRDGLIFPYFQGLIFNLHMTRKGGFDRVHAAYQSPPVSSEQILHPAKYLEQVDEPYDLRFPQPASLFPSGWKHLGGNCLGEFQTSILLRSVRQGTVAAEGWDGDRYEVFEQDGKLGLVWLSIWDSPLDAEEFEGAMDSYVRAKGLEESYAIERNDLLVKYVQGLDRTACQEVLKRMDQSQRSLKKFPASPKPATTAPAP